LSSRPALRVWGLDPEWLVYLASYRLFNHLGTTWHYLSGGPRVQALGQAYKHLSRQRRSEEHVSSALFSSSGAGYCLSDPEYYQGDSSLFAEGDLALVIERRDGLHRHRWPIRTPAQLEALGSLLSQLTSGLELEGLPPRARVRSWFLRLKLAGVLVPSARVTAKRRARDSVVRSTGHAGLAFETPTTRVLVDPLFTLRYRPEVDRRHELRAPLDAVVLTQPQWGHLDLDTLLCVDRSVPVYVRRREGRRSLDNVDLAALARELGFGRVVELEAWQNARIGDIAITALPFHGAGSTQDAAADWMTLLVDLGGRRVFVTANACRDARGSFDDVVREVRRRVGPVHVLVAGYLHYAYPIAWFTRRPFYLGPGREQATTAPADGPRWATLLGAEALVFYAGFAWSEAELWRPPCAQVLYGGVVQKGCLAEAVEGLEDWTTPSAFALAPGASLRWQRGQALRAFDSSARALRPLNRSARVVAREAQA